MFIEQKKLLDVDTVRRYKPLTSDLAAKKESFDSLLIDNFLSRKKFVTVCGPCSADGTSAMREYLSKLKELDDKLENLITVARVYTSKPHSNGQGYLGSCFFESNGVCDINEGILLSRQMMLDCIDIGLPVADELLYPEFYPYFADLVSYWFIGARSSEDALHRCLASGLDVCCGVKNPTDGNIEKAADSLFAVSNSCVFPLSGSQVATRGAKYSHLVLRGGFLDDKYYSNISEEHVLRAKELLRQHGLNDFIMADLSHANSGKIASNQLNNAKLVCKDKNVDGAMVESFLKQGANSKEYGVSRTDDCLNFEDTEKVLKILNSGFSERE